MGDAGRKAYGEDVEYEVFIKVHEVDNLGSITYVVGVCDAELLGSTYVEGDIRLEVNREFFGGFKASIDEALEYVRQAYTGMLVGQRVIDAAIRSGLIHPESVFKVKGIPYAQFVKF